MQVLLIGDDLRVDFLLIDSSEPESAVWFSILPAELKPHCSKPFVGVHGSAYSQSVSVSWDESASSNDISWYKGMFNDWPGGT